MCPATLHWKKLVSPFPAGIICKQLPIYEWIFVPTLPSYCWNFVWIEPAYIFERFQSLMCVSILLCLEDAVSLETTTTSDSFFYFFLLLYK